MGGIGTIIGDVARTAVSKIPYLASRGGEETVSRTEGTLNDVVGAKDAYFRVGGAFGAKIRQLHMDWQTVRAAALDKLDAPVDVAQKQVLAHPTLRNSAGLDTPVLHLYQEAQRVNHPLARPGGELDQLVMQHPGNELKSLNELKNQNVQQARVLASAQVFGPKMENVIPYIMPLLASRDPLEESWAKGVMNLISNETRDTAPNIHGGARQTVSSAKQAIADEIGRRNNAIRLQAIASGRIAKGADGKYDLSPIRDEMLKPFDTSSTYMRPDPKGLERRIQNVLRVVQLPMVALKHLSTVGNLSSIPAPWLAKGLLQMSEPEFRAFRDSTHILTYTDHDFMDRAMRGGTGIVSRLTGNPTAGQVFFKSYHMPFFDFVRSKQLSYAASVGWTATQNWARQALKGSRIAIANLKEIGIEPEEVIRQNGILNEDQLRKGVFHFVNNRFFLDKTVEQALYSNHDPVMRSATMYHTFVNAQARFLRRELVKMVKARDFVGIAQFAGTIGILWPAVAPMVKSLEVFARTLKPKAAIASAKQDYSNLGSGNPTKMVHTYLDLLSYYAAFGIYTNYIAAAHGDRLGYAIIGPSLGVPLRYASDVTNMVTRTDSAGKHNAAPVVRDTLEDFVPIAGNVLAHHIAPTQAELNLEKGKVSRRPRRQKQTPDDKYKF